MIKTLTAAIASVMLSGGLAMAQVPIGSLHGPRVEVRGTIAEVFGNRFILEDDSGRILVETGPEWYRDHDFAVGERITVEGEVEEGSLDAFLLRREDGSEIRVRPADGPPPWAGGAK